MTHEQIEQGSIEKLGRLSPAFCVGAEWAIEQMQRQLDQANEDGEQRARQEVIALQNMQRAFKWLENAINGENIEGCNDAQELIEDFKQAMLSKNKEL